MGTSIKIKHNEGTSYYPDCDVDWYVDYMGIYRYKYKEQEIQSVKYWSSIEHDSSILTLVKLKVKESND